MRTLVMGDKHGGFKAMIQVLGKAGFDPKKDRLIDLGDIADGWSETPQIVDYFLKCKNLIAIRGNHDLWLQEWLTYGIAEDIWLEQGGIASIEAYDRRAINHDDHRDFFKKQINYFIDEENRGFVHGGYLSAEGLGHDAPEIYYWDRRMWDIAMSGHNSQTIPKLLQAHKEIFIGHSSTLYWKEEHPMHRCNVWNIDTGGGWHGRITVMDVETKEYWQSDPVKELYPDEFGRR